MLHFFVDSGIKDTLYYWGEFQKSVKLFIELKRECPELNAFNLGGGFPIRNHLGFEYDYEYMIREIVNNIKDACTAEGIEEPDIYTEFGKYTVGESGATIFSVLDQKQQNDAELWYIIDNSLMNTIPDAWSIFEKFILLPINKWNNEYTRAVSYTHLAWGATRTKGTYFRAKYESMIGRRGKKRALLAIGHKILVASYHILKDKVPYQELGANYLLERKKKNKIDYLKRQLKELGYNIEKIEEAA